MTSSRRYLTDSPQYQHGHEREHEHGHSSSSSSSSSSLYTTTNKNTEHNPFAGAMFFPPGFRSRTPSNIRQEHRRKQNQNQNQQQTQSSSRAFDTRRHDRLVQQQDVLASASSSDYSLAAKFGLTHEEFQQAARDWRAQRPMVPITPAPPSAFEVPSLGRPQMDDARKRFGVLRSSTIALVGAPNAGKSSLVNALSMHRVSAVNRKRNTTQRKILASFTLDEKQLVFYDTPGLIEARPGFMALGWESASEADQCVMVVDGAIGNLAKLGTHEKLCRKVLDARKNTGKSEPLLVLTKMDRTTVTKYSDAITKWVTVGEFKAVFTVSSLDNMGIDHLRYYLLSQCEEKDWLLDPNIPCGDAPMDVVHDAVRETLLHNIHDEVPYMLEVVNKGWTELPNGVLRIDEVVRAPKRQHVPLIKGADGKRVNVIQRTAQAAIEESLKRKVHLVVSVESKEA